MIFLLFFAQIWWRNNYRILLICNANRATSDSYMSKKNSSEQFSGFKCIPMTNACFFHAQQDNAYFLQDFNNPIAKHMKYWHSWKFQVSRLSSSTARSLQTLLLHSTPFTQLHSTTLYEDRLDIPVCFSLVCEWKCNKVYISLQLVSRWKQLWYLFPCTTIFTKVRGTFTTRCVPFYTSPISCTSQYIPFYEVRRSIKRRKVT